jgi:mono/diheme cytochrome c family protein/glucose/arabinose dehydrogenase
MRHLCHAVAVTLFLTAAAALAQPTAVPDSPKDLPHEPADPVPLLSAEEAIARMSLPAGYRMQVVAAEPLVERPVAMTFDETGRLWVVEMRSYMPNVKGEGEDAPTGRVTVLDDDDHDGRMDRATVFLDGLVLPRAICRVRGGLLVAAPPNVWFCRDTNGDDKCDSKELIASDYGVTGNPEHMANGLMPALDNWIYNANYPKRFRYVRGVGGGGSWQSEVVPELGQWGVTQDNFGRLIHNSNSDYLRGSFIPIHYADRNPHYRAAGANEQLDADQSLWPAHKTATDRGYLPRFVREDGVERIFTSACGPLLYRGGVMPAFDGNVFVCEPTANLIRRSAIHEDGGRLIGKNAHDGQSEFLTSTYERFRPVNLSPGPDGAIYVVDMHHGLIQHRVYLTSYLKNQYLQKHLEKHLDTGRIYRIVPDGFRQPPPLRLGAMRTAELVPQLGHANGWVRDTAQRLLVERDDYKAVPLLRKVATSDANALARLHAMWTLEGFGVSDPKVILPALKDADSRVRAAAIRLAEPLLASHLRPQAFPAVMNLAASEDADVRLQFVLTMSSQGTPETDDALVGILESDSSNLYVRDALMTGCRGRELALLRQLLSSKDYRDERKGRPAMLTALTKAVLAERVPKRVAAMLDLIAAEPTDGWRQLAMLEAFPNPPRNARPPRPIILDAPPAALLSLKSTTATTAPASTQRADRVDRVFTLVHWPGQPGYVPPPPPRPLTNEEQTRFESGRQVYAKTCLQCHKPDGRGQAGLAPPLVESEWVLGTPSRLVHIVTNGLQGPVTVAGRTFSLEMPGLPTLSDTDVAAVLTYVRREWDHDADPVDVEYVTAVRGQTKRTTPWTERELLKIDEPRLPVRPARH